MAADDPFDKALRDLERALDANARRMAQIKRRIAEIRRQRSAGRSYREIVEAAKGDLSVQLITEASEQMTDLLDQLRTAAQIEGKRWEPGLAEANTLELASSEDARIDATGNGQTIETDAAMVIHDRPSVAGSSSRSRRVLLRARRVGRR